VKDSNLRSFRDGIADQRRHACDQRKCVSTRQLTCVFPTNSRRPPTTAGHYGGKVSCPSDSYCVPDARVGSKTVNRWADTGKLTSLRTLGGHRRFRESGPRPLRRNRLLTIGPRHTLAQSLVNCAPGRAGASLDTVTTGQRLLSKLQVALNSATRPG
jgi:hypothetical protein